MVVTFADDVCRSVGVDGPAAASSATGRVVRCVPVHGRRVNVGRAASAPRSARIHAS